MKRTAAITAIILVIVMLFSQFAFCSAPVTTVANGGKLEIVNVLPKDGSKGKQATNMAVKIQFSEPVTNTANDAKNKACIKITSEEGDVLSFEIAHHPKHQDELWLILNDNLKSDMQYTVTVSEGITADSGAVLGKGMVSTFKSKNAKTDSTINMLMMVGMVVVMVMATRSSQKNDKDKAPKNAPSYVDNANPYRLAKERGISVDEAKAIIEKDKEKEAKKNKAYYKNKEKADAAAAEREAKIAAREKEIREASIYHVKSRGSLVEHGGKISKEVQKKLNRFKKNPRR